MTQYEQVINLPLSVSELDASIVGLGLTYTLSLAGSLQYCIRLSGDIENVVRRVYGSDNGCTFHSVPFLMLDAFG